VGLLLGRGGDAFAANFTDRFPEYRGRILAPGYMAPASVAKYLSACDLLILPYPDGASSRRSSLMAALALGIPTLTTTGSSTESFWRDDTTVALVPAGDSEAFARTAKTLLASPITLKTLAEHGARIYREKFSIDRTVEVLRAAARRTENLA
jgi:glycosyltransferase involved in cell wall biosynthesis